MKTCDDFSFIIIWFDLTVFWYNNITYCNLEFRQIKTLIIYIAVKYVTIGCPRLR